MDRGIAQSMPTHFFGLRDEEIAAHAKEGDNRAAEYLLVKYRALVEGKARSYFLAGADHEDIVQEGMIGLYKAIRDFRSDRPSGFRAFAELCVTRQIITAVKSATRQKHLPLNKCISLHRMVSDDDTSGTPLIDTLADKGVLDPEKTVIAAEIKDRLESADTELSKLESHVLKCYMQGMSYKEMSTLLSCPTKTIDNALQRAKRKMGEKIARD